MPLPPRHTVSFALLTPSHSDSVAQLETPNTIYCIRTIGTLCVVFVYLWSTFSVPQMGRKQERKTPIQTATPQSAVRYPPNPTNKHYKYSLWIFWLMSCMLFCQDERQMLKRHSREKRTDRSQRLQDKQSFMDSQGSGNSSSSSEAWGSHTHSPRGEESPESRYQYCETSLSPLLHPMKRPATNPPPISNQATKGTTVIWLLYNIYISVVRAKERLFKSTKD